MFFYLKFHGIFHKLVENQFILNITKIVLYMNSTLKILSLKMADKIIVIADISVINE